MTLFQTIILWVGTIVGAILLISTLIIYFRVLNNKGFDNETDNVKVLLFFPFLIFVSLCLFAPCFLMLMGIPVYL